MDGEQPVFGLERRGFDHIPEAERSMTLRETAYFWVGTNANLFFVAVGVIALELGLERVAGARRRRARHAAVRDGRARLDRRRPRRAADHDLHARGVRTARQPARTPCWRGRHLGRVRGDQLHLRRVRAARAASPSSAGRTRAPRARSLATLVVLGASAAIAIYGHATMVYVQRFFAVALTLVLLLVLAYCVGGVEWSARGARGRSRPWETVAAHPRRRRGDRLGPDLLPLQRRRLGPLPAQPDGERRDLLDRFAEQRRDRARSCRSWASCSPRAATCPTRSPACEPFVPGWLFVLYILAAVGGSIANNVVAYYSSGLCLQSLGLPLRRYQATALDIALATRMVLVHPVHARTSRPCCTTSSR